MMTRISCVSRPLWISFFLIGLNLLLSATVVSAGDDTLTLRINDTTAEPGGEVAVVMRTYASRPIRQGQLCMHASSPGRGQKGAASPFAQLERVIVYSPTGDVISQSSFAAPTQSAEVEFSSLSAGINSVDGPMVAFFFRLDSALLPGETFVLDLDPDQTFLLDALGQPVPIRIRPGELTIHAPGEPRSLAVDGDDVASGAVAVVGIETDELFPVGSGQVSLLYDPSVVLGQPTVTMDERYGLAEFHIVDSTPGKLLVRFRSPDGSLNKLPGTFLTIFLPTDPAVPEGTQSPLSFDPAETSLWDPQGLAIPLELSGDTLVFSAGSFFTDGFESGGLQGWSVTSP